MVLFLKIWGTRGNTAIASLNTALFGRIAWLRGNNDAPFSNWTGMLHYASEILSYCFFLMKMIQEFLTCFIIFACLQVVHPSLEQISLAWMLHPGLLQVLLTLKNSCQGIQHNLVYSVYSIALKEYLSNTSIFFCNITYNLNTIASNTVHWALQRRCLHHESVRDGCWLLASFERVYSSHEASVFFQKGECSWWISISSSRQKQLC